MIMTGPHPYGFGVAMTDPRLHLALAPAPKEHTP